MLFDYDASLDCLYTRYTGHHLVLDGLFEWVNAFFAQPEFRTGINALWDASPVETVVLSFADMQAFGDFVLARRHERGGGRSGFVTNNDLLFGLFRTHEMLNESKFDYEFRVFRSLETARAWVRDADPA